MKQLLILGFALVLCLVGCSNKPTITWSESTNPVTGAKIAAGQVDTNHNGVRSLTHPNLSSLMLADSDGTVKPLGTGASGSMTDAASNIFRAVFFPGGITIKGGGDTVTNNVQGGSGGNGGPGGQAVSGSASTAVSGGGT